MQTKLPIWWEKTVEYKFVAELALANRLAFAAPLSGKQERTAGDTTIGHADKFILIEYKRTKNHIHSEHEIFHNFEEARELFKDAEHHLVVYGFLSQDKKLELAAKNYFSNRNTQAAQITDIVDLGVSLEHFIAYLKALCAFKIPYGGSSGGSGGLHASMDDMCAVMGVSLSGAVVSSYTLAEFSLEFCPDLQISLDEEYAEDDLDFTPSSGPGL